VQVEADRIFVRSGKYWTSAGITAGIDLALAMIEADLGEEIARAVARQLVVYYRRPGGQSQFSALGAVAPPQGRFAPLVRYIRENLARRLSIDELAAKAGMSERHFARAFAAECGDTPAKAVEKLRADAARAALESGATSVKRVAEETGFGDAERMRRAFQRVYGIAPSALKRA
jgi:transcriptional regulator GlxA family with amidase domain